MFTTLADLIMKTVHYSDLDVTFRSSYSGRGMYGSKCVGIVGDRDVCMQLIGEVIVELESLSLDNFPDYVSALMEFSSDSMGRSDSIIYWTAIPTDDLTEQEDADESYDV